jgi:hypothetical protein
MVAKYIYKIIFEIKNKNRWVCVILHLSLMKKEINAFEDNNYRPARLPKRWYAKW